MKTAVDLICTRKRESNVENSVGLISMKYSGPEISLHLTEERRWNSALAKIELSHGRGSIDITESIRKARLALKHKRNSKQEKRIIVIVCSPITTDVKTLMRTAKDLKKNGLSLDIICFGVPEGHETETVKNLRDMVAKCNKADSSHFVHLAEETHNNALQDVIVSSAIIQGFQQNIPVQAQQNQAPAGAAPAGGEHIEGMPEGIDPNTDPELYHAIRMSLEMARQQVENEAENPENADANGGDAEMQNAEAQAPAPPQPAAPVASSGGDTMDADDEDDELAAAIAMSMQEEDGDDIDPDDLQAALALSMQDDDNAAAVEPQQNQENNEEDEDKDFLANLMAEMPGVDADEIDIEAIMENLNEVDETDKDKPEKRDD